MGPFDFKGTSSHPYSNDAANLIYNLLFCDNLELYKENTQVPVFYPFNILFTEPGDVATLRKIANDKTLDARVRVLANNKLLLQGIQPGQKDLLGVIVELGLEDGLDTLAAFSDGTARYINQTGKILVWETPNDAKCTSIITELFKNSAEIVKRIGPWDQPRRQSPPTGNLRITFLVSDGLYFGEGPIDFLFNDAMAGPALNSATELLQFLTEKQ